MAVGTYISIITLNVNGLNAPTKRHKLAEWIQKQDPYICSPQETHFRPQDTHRLKVKGWKNIFHANGKQKKAGVAILILDKIDLKIKKITKDNTSEHICKNSQQNFSKQNSATHQKAHIPWSSWVYSRNAGFFNISNQSISPY